jgi:hypothetical protein
LSTPSQDKLKEQTFLASVDDPSLTPQQHVVLKTFRELRLHRQLLLLVIGSASFKTYLHGLVRLYDKSEILPRRDRLEAYIQFKRAKLCSIETQAVGAEKNVNEQESAQDAEGVRVEEDVRIEEDDEYNFYLESISSLVGDI